MLKSSEHVSQSIQNSARTAETVYTFKIVKTHWRSCCSFPLQNEMKKFLAVALIAIGVAYYFGYDLSDFIPSFSGNSRPKPKVRRAPAPTEQTQSTTPEQSNTSTVTTNSSDGSLANRWQSYPSPSPTKP
jgi:hypothetical protein